MSASQYRPGYPKKPFASREGARDWVDGFVAWYNGTHLHSGIRFVTPNARHEGRDIAILAARRNVYATARSVRLDAGRARLATGHPSRPCA